MPEIRKCPQCDAAMPADGFIRLDVSGIDPVDDGFRGNVAVLACLEDGECIFHFSNPYDYSLDGCRFSRRGIGCVFKAI